jgi:hypothetical protein
MAALVVVPCTSALVAAPYMAVEEDCMAAEEDIPDVLEE